MFVVLVLVVVVVVCLWWLLWWWYVGGAGIDGCDGGGVQLLCLNGGHCRSIGKERKSVGVWHVSDLFANGIAGRGGGRAALWMLCRV